MDFWHDHCMEEAEKADRQARVAGEEAARLESEIGPIVQYSES